MNMNVPDYVGVITGVIGAITGICGSIMGYIAYRRSNDHKAVDLRIELKKSLSSAYVIHEKALEIIEHAEKSRVAVNSAKGLYRSGAMEKFLKELEKDKKAIIKLVLGLPIPGEEYEKYTVKELEKEIVEVHRVSVYVGEYVKKYESELEKDEDDRKFIREQAHKNTHGD